MTRQKQISARPARLDLSSSSSCFTGGSLLAVPVGTRYPPEWGPAAALSPSESGRARARTAECTPLALPAHCTLPCRVLTHTHTYTHTHSEKAGGLDCITPVFFHLAVFFTFFAFPLFFPTGCLILPLSVKHHDLLLSGYEFTQPEKSDSRIASISVHRWILVSTPLVVGMPLLSALGSPSSLF